MELNNLKCLTGEEFFEQTHSIYRDGNLASKYAKGPLILIERVRYFCCFLFDFLIPHIPLFACMRY